MSDTPRTDSMEPYGPPYNDDDALLHIPKTFARKLERELGRYKEVVNSILNVEQQQLLAQKLHEIQDTQDA